MQSKDEPPPKAEPADLPRWPDGGPRFGVRLDVDMAILAMARGEPYDEDLLWKGKTRELVNKAVS